MNKIQFSPTALKNLKELPRMEKKKIQRKLKFLEEDAHTGKKLSAELEGFYSIRAWPYRIIYEIISKNKIGVVRIQHRKDVYRK